MTSTKEILVTYDEKGEQVIDEPIDFPPVEAGQRTERTLWLHNTTKYYINVNVSVEGKDVKLEEDVDILLPEMAHKIVLVFNPALTSVVPPKAWLNVQYDYVIK